MPDPLRVRIARFVWAAGRRVLVGRTQPCPPARLTCDKALALAAAAVRASEFGGSALLSNTLTIATARIVDGRIVWQVSTATIGSGLLVDVDDATGMAGPPRRWGVR